MSKERYLHFVASFLIVLILSLPLYTSSAYATINSVSVKGSTGIDGFAKQNDYLDFSVLASIDNGTITKDMVSLGNNIKFASCAPSIDGFSCTLRYPSSATQSFEVKLIPFTINLRKNDGTLDDSKSGSVLIDNKPPQVTLSAGKKFSSQQSVVVNYDVRDSACDDPSCSGQCVGIKSIKFYTLDSTFSQSVDSNSSSCSLQSSITVPISTFPEGPNSIFAKATDRFDQASQETSVTFNVKTTPPSILGDSFSIKRKGMPLSTFSNNGVSADVSVNISGSDLDLDSVIADFSSLNPNLKNAKASCASDGNLSFCAWSISLNPGQSGLKTISINASDTSGNSAGITVNKQMDLDDKGPILQSLSTSTSLSNTSVLAKLTGNKVTAVFDESTGLSSDDVFLSVDQSKTQADNCTKDTNWICTWNSIDFTSSTSMSISPDTADILGNLASNINPVAVTVDSAPPVLNSINITNIGGLTQAFDGIFKIGDKIAVVANLTEDNDVSASGDFSKFIEGASNVPGSCQRIEADQHVCTWLTDSINLQASSSIVFNFSDNAGNTLTVTRTLKTFGLENATVPDFWDSSVSCSPSTIDRSIGPLINQKVYCQVILRPKSSSKPISTVFISPATCSDDSSIIDSVETLNSETGSTSPILKLTLKKDDFRIDNSNISCQLNIFSKIGSSTTITKNPEIENINLNLQFYNNPIGELGQEVQDKIDQAKKDAQGIYDIIGALNKIVFYAKKICQIYGVIYNVVALLYTAAVLFRTTTDLTCTSFYGFAVCPVLYNVGTGACNSQQAARNTAQTGWKIANKFCAFVNCKMTALWGPAVQNFINNQLPFANYIGPKTTTTDEGFGLKSVNVAGGDQFQQPGKMQFGLPLSQYMNPQNNLIVATLFACLPGIIYGLEKYRQVKCLYADCLQNGVGKEGLPVTACEDQKAFATCKYVTGEIFAIIPYTAVFDHFMGLIKNVLSNPFLLIGAGVSLLCWSTCPAPPPSSTFLYTACEGAKLFATLGSVIGDVKDIIDNGFTIRTDYCARLDTTTPPAAPASTATTQTSSGTGATNTSKV